jgi:deoxyguanosine kinase
MYNYIAIEGNIGAGKTALANLIAAEMDRQPILEEFRDKAYLERFYQDPERYAFPLEISFLVERYQQLSHALSSGSLFKSGFVADYMFDKSLIFASCNLNEDQYHLFKELFDVFTAQLPFPDVVIYLHRPIKQVVEQIKSRGRPFELAIPESYLTKVEEGYHRYLSNMAQKRIINIDLGEADFVNESHTFQQILKLLKQDQATRYHTLELNHEGELVEKSPIR